MLDHRQDRLFRWVAHSRRIHRRSGQRLRHEALSGDYAASFAYNVSSNVGVVTLRVDFYPDAGCPSGTSTPRFLDDSSITTGSFQLVQGTVNAPAGTDSVRFELRGNCRPDMFCSVVFDDVSLEVPTTAVSFRSLSATATAQGVAVRWRTACSRGCSAFASTERW